MTKYELLSLIISIIALVAPAARWIYKNWIKKEKLQYHPNGKITLFFNRSSSYLRLDGVLEALNHPISVKKMEVVVNKNQNTSLTLPWSVFYSPFTQQISGAPIYSSMTEIAHPFKIEEDSIYCVFTEFSNNDANNTIMFYLKDLFNKANELIIFARDYTDALEQYKNCDLYRDVKGKISSMYFWDIGKYEFVLRVSYLNSVKEFSFFGEIRESDYEKLYSNVEEVLLYPLKVAYKQQSNNKAIIIDISQTN